jgi:predicted transcriptional regulator with HTH domain
VLKKMADTVSEVIKSMSDNDIYSSILTFLFELHKVPEYSLLSELIYIVKDKESFMNLMNCFAGKTVKFPSKDELAEIIQVLKLYQYYEIDHMSWKDAVISAGFDSRNGKLATNRLNTLKDTIKKYNFGNR